MSIKMSSDNPIVLQPSSLFQEPQASSAPASTTVWSSTWVYLLEDLDQFKINASDPRKTYKVSDKTGNPIFHSDKKILKREIPILQSRTNEEILHHSIKDKYKSIILCKESLKTIARVSMESSDCCCSGSDQVYKVEDSRGNPILILGQKTMGSGWNIYRSTPRNNNGAGDIPLGELNFSDSYSFDDCCKISCCSGTITPYTITVTFPKDLEVTSKAALFAVVQLMEFRRLHEDESNGICCLILSECDVDCNDCDGDCCDGDCDCDCDP